MDVDQPRESKGGRQEEETNVWPKPEDREKGFSVFFFLIKFYFICFLTFAFVTLASDAVLASGVRHGG